MALERWEIQFLLLLAQNRNSLKAGDLLREFEPRLSLNGKALARRIVKGTKVSNRLAESAEIFIRRADGRTAERKSRQLAEAF
jgi:hypothetical protein